MPHYRCYPLNAEGHITGPALDIDCEDDRAAVAQACKLSLEPGVIDVEIWTGARRVAGVGIAGRAQAGRCGTTGLSMEEILSERAILYE